MIPNVMGFMLPKSTEFMLPKDTEFICYMKSRNSFIT